MPAWCPHVSCTLVIVSPFKLCVLLTQQPPGDLEGQGHDPVCNPRNSVLRVKSAAAARPSSAAKTDPDIMPLLASHLDGRNTDRSSLVSLSPSRQSATQLRPNSSGASFQQPIPQRDSNSCFNRSSRSSKHLNNDSSASFQDPSNHTSDIIILNPPQVIERQDYSLPLQSWSHLFPSAALSASCGSNCLRSFT